MYPKWRSLCGIFTLAAFLAILGCGGSGNSNVRAVNASPGFPPFTFQAAQIDFAAGLPYGTEGVQPAGQYSTNDTSGAYRHVGAGTNQPLSTWSTPGTILVSQKITLAKNTSYTVVSYGISPSMGLAVLTDNGTAPASGQYGLRCLNYSSYSSIDVYITAVGDSPSGTPIVGNLGFNNNPGYIPSAPGTLELQVTPHGSTTPLGIEPFTPAAGQNYSVFFMNPTPGSSDFIILVVPDPITTITKTTM